MTATRSIREELWYRKYRRSNKDSGCPFCAIANDHDQYVDETNNFIVMKNFLPYSIWDGQGVVDHLMVIPKQHKDGLNGMSDESAVEYMKLLGEYESRGYNIYARAPDSAIKSVPHQHTHLIKPDHKTKKWLLYLKKPFYLRISG